MKPTNQFLSSLPSRKPEQISDGYEFLATTIDTTTLNLRKLNQWLEAMPEMLVNKQSAVPGESLRKAYEQFARASDAMTAEMVANAEALKKLYETIQLIEEYGSTSKPVSNK